MKEDVNEDKRANVGEDLNNDMDVEEDKGQGRG